MRSAYRDAVEAHLRTYPHSSLGAAVVAAGMPPKFYGPHEIDSVVRNCRDVLQNHGFHDELDAPTSLLIDVVATMVARYIDDDGGPVEDRRTFAQRARDYEYSAEGILKHPMLYSAALTAAANIASANAAWALSATSLLRWGLA